MSGFSNGIFGKRQRPTLFEEGPKTLSAFPPLKATAVWVPSPCLSLFLIYLAPMARVLFPVWIWAAFVILVSHSLSPISLSAKQRCCFPMVASGKWVPQIYGRQPVPAAWGNRKYWILPYSLTSILPLLSCCFLPPLFSEPWAPRAFTALNFFISFKSCFPQTSKKSCCQTCSFF